MRTSPVPIAIAYHLAHYLTYFLIQGQLVIRLVSDPFGRGWNLFGSAGYVPDIGVVGARFAGTRPSSRSSSATCSPCTPRT